MKLTPSIGLMCVLMVFGSAVMSAATGSAQTSADPGAGSINSQPPNQETAMTDIHDIKPTVAVAIGNPWRVYLAIVAALLILLAAGYWLWRRQSGATATESLPPPIPPEVLAMQALEQLARDRNGVINGQTFYFRLSDILRHYIDSRFQLGASKMTTEEFVPRVENLELDHDLKRSLITLCQGADPVKFAKAPVDDSQMDADLRFVEAFVKQTTSHV